MRELLYKEYIVEIIEQMDHTDVEVIKDEIFIMHLTFDPGVTDDMIIQGVQEGLDIYKMLHENGSPKKQ